MSEPSIQVYGTRGSAQAFAVRDFLTRSDVPFEWIELKTDEQARSLAHVDGLHDGRGRAGGRLKVGIIAQKSDPETPGIGGRREGFF